MYQYIFTVIAYKIIHCYTSSKIHHVNGTAKEIRFKLIAK